MHSPYTFPQSLQEATCRVTNRTEALIQLPVCSDPLSVHILSCVCVFPCDFITSVDFHYHCHSQGTGQYPFLDAVTSFALPPAVTTGHHCCGPQVCHVICRVGFFTQQRSLETPPSACMGAMVWTCVHLWKGTLRWPFTGFEYYELSCCESSWTGFCVNLFHFSGINSVEGKC